MIKHLVSVLPESLEQRSSEGWTPLHVALATEREDVVSYLVSIGADQRARDKFGRNVVHALVGNLNSVQSDAKKLQAMIDLFNKEGVKQMLLERCTNHPGALTPLAYWMSCGKTWQRSDIVEVLSKYSTGQDLEMINGEGDLPLHVAVKNNLSSITAFLLSLNPSLLYRENATGRTPMEMARDLYIASAVKDPPNVFIDISYNPNYEHHNSIVRQPASSFVTAKSVLEETKKRTYETCVQVDQDLITQGFEGEARRKRRLVSLFEANEVAKRLAGNCRPGGSWWSAYGYTVHGARADLVSEWMS